MARALLIAEKPDLMRKIQSAYQKHRSEYADTIDFAAFAGHTLELCEPHDYEAKWEKWDLSLIPMIPSTFKYRITDNKKGLYDDIMRRLNTHDYDYVINACDAGREGQHIFHSFYRHAGLTLPVKRFWSNEMTVSAHHQALSNLRDDAEPRLSQLTEASFLRARFDWLMGMNFTRAFSLKVNKTCNLGRVMTPILNLVVQRELEIRNFIPVEYYELEGLFAGELGAKLLNEDGTFRFEQKTALETIQASLKGVKTATVQDVTYKTKKNPSPQFFNLQVLQTEANKLFGFTGKQTDEYIQHLYDNGWVSYPRTDSQYVGDDTAKTFPDILKNLTKLSAFDKIGSAILGNTTAINGVTKSKRYVDTTKVTDHYAIIPTADSVPNLATLSKGQLAIYELIVKRFLVAFYPDQEVGNTTILVDVKGHTFKAQGGMVLEKGWTKLYPIKTAEKVLPTVKKGETISVDSLKRLSNKTKPPGRYTEGGLIEACENAGKFIEEKELKTVMKEAAGLGNSSTRSSTIEKLVRVKMLTRKGKSMEPTELGLFVIESLDGHDIASVKLTAEWEQKLVDIEEGKLNPKDFESQMITYVQRQSDTFKAKSYKKVTAATSGNAEVVGTCPACGGRVLKGKNAYYCENFKPKAEATSDSCSLALSFTSFGAKISATDLKAILAGKETKEKTLTYDGKSYKGVFYYDATQKRIRTKSTGTGGGSGASKNTTPANPKLGTCPLCKKGLKETSSYLMCQDYKNPCAFILGKQYWGADLTTDELVALAAGKTVGPKTVQYSSGARVGELYYDKASKKLKLK